MEEPPGEEQKASQGSDLHTISNSSLEKTSGARSAKHPDALVRLPAFESSLLAVSWAGRGHEKKDRQRGVNAVR